MPDFVQISGEQDPTLCEKAVEWFQLFEKNELQSPRLIPNGYQEALEYVRANSYSIDLVILAEKIGVSENLLTRCLSGDTIGGKTVHISNSEGVELKDLARSTIFYTIDTHCS